MNELKTLYLSDIYLKSKRTLNTLALFYDKIYLHDFYGGLSTGLTSYSPFTEKSTIREEFVNNRHYLNEYIREGVLQGCRYSGSKERKVRESFLQKIVSEYSDFIVTNKDLINEGIISFCHTRQNPHLAPLMIYKDVKITSENECSEKDCNKFYEEIRQQNKLCCLFEEKYHNLPLITDSNEDLIKWDKSKDQLSLAFLSAAFIAQVPTLSTAHSGDIIQCKIKLEPYLKEFKKEVFKICWDISQAAKSNAKEEVMLTAKLYYETKVAHIIEDLTDKLTKDNAKLFNNIIEKGIDKTMLIFKAIDPSEKASKWDLLGEGLKSAFQVENVKIEYEKNCSPYEYLVRLPFTVRGE